MPRIRVQRFEKELLKLISKTINYKLRDKYLDFVTITEVKLTNDLSQAKVYYSHLSEYALEDIQKALEKSTGMIKQSIAELKLMRRIPEIIFIFDEVEENARKLDEIFTQIKTENRED
jgi:ribosome-binding factor A